MTKLFKAFFFSFWKIIIIGFGPLSLSFILETRSLASHTHVAGDDVDGGGGNYYYAGGVKVEGRSTEICGVKPLKLSLFSSRLDQRFFLLPPKPLK